MSKSQAERSGKAKFDPPPPTAETGKQETADSWTARTSVADEVAAQMAEFARNKAQKLPAPLAAAMLAQVMPPLARQMAQDGAITKTQAFADWRKNPVGEFPMAVMPAEDAQAIGAKNPVARMNAGILAKQEREHGEMTDAEYADAQRVISLGKKHQAANNQMIYALEEPSEKSGGRVLVVRVDKEPDGIPYTVSYRRLSRNEAKRDKEIARLFAKGQK